MKRIIKEQKDISSYDGVTVVGKIPKKSVPSANALNTNGIINEPFNTYKDPQNKEFIETFTILSLNQGTQGSFNIEVKDNQGNRDKFFFKCSDAGLGQDGYSNSLYSNNLVNELKKRYCTKSTGGAEVPNATFASTTNKNPQANAMAEGKRIVKLTEADLTRLVKRVINEQTKLKTFSCFDYFRSKGIEFGQDGGNYSSWYPNVPGYYIEGNLTHDDYEPSVYFYKEDKLNKLIPMNPKLVTTIKSLASTMGGEFGVDGKDMYKVDFQPGRCKNFGEFGLKLINLLKQSK